MKHFLNLDNSKNANKNNEAHVTVSLNCPIYVNLESYENSEQAITEARKRGYLRAFGVQFVAKMLEKCKKILGFK